MRHRVKDKKIGTDSNHTKAIIKGMVTSLIEHGSIETTVTKAKEISRVADKLIGKARDNSLNTRRTLHTFFGKRDVVNTLVDRVAPVFGERISGFTRVVKIGPRRGDNTPMARLSLVEQSDVTGTLRSPGAAKKNAETKAARKAGQKTAQSAATKTAVVEKSAATKSAAKKAAPKKSAAAKPAKPAAKKVLKAAAK
jgi:large subunit ribosomal protein L17